MLFRSTQLKDSGFNYIKFTGGEPFLRDDFLKILQMASSLNFSMDVSTNASLITEDLSYQLSLLHLNFIHVSLDGYDIHSHESVRGKNTFNKTIIGLHNLLKFNKNIRVGTVIHKNNENYLQKIVDFVDIIQVKTIIFSLMKPIGRMHNDTSFIAQQSTENIISNIFIGKCTGYHNGTANNIFVGDCAGFNTTYGNENIFIGDMAGLCNTTGYYNNFLGAEAGIRNTTGWYNTFLGSFAGARNTTGNYNVFIGGKAGFYNTTGQKNVFLGTWTGKCNTGDSNFFVGCKAGSYNAGAFNNFIGVMAGAYNGTGSYNNFLGINSGNNNTTGCNNTFIGCNAGLENTTGSYNIAIGRRAAQFNTTGIHNTTLGRYAGRFWNNSWHNIFMGAYAGYGIYNVSSGYQRDKDIIKKILSEVKDEKEKV